MDTITLLRTGFLGATVTVLVFNAIPTLRSRFMSYGARSVPSKTTSKSRESQSPGLLDWFGQLQVPHSWFASFYVVSIACLLVWLTQLTSRGPGFAFIDAHTAPQSKSMTVRQVAVTWAFMTAQSSRRLYECLTFARPSRSQMWIGHWLIGIAYYVAVSMAIWVEGIPSIREYRFTVHDMQIVGPDVRTFIATLLFILASGFQHDCHAYLASLKPTNTSPRADSEDEYKLPTHPAFTSLVAPHYTAECIIYLALAIIATPQGAWVNWTMVCVLVFATVNLGVTADGTKKWYEARFGKESVARKRRMIPWAW